MELIPLMEAMKTGDKYRDYCIDDAIFHIKKASEALTEGLRNPKEWYEMSQSGVRLLAKSLPFILAVQMSESLGDSDQTPAENLSETPGSAQ